MTQSAEPSLEKTDEGVLEKILNEIETGSEEEMNVDFTWIKLGKGEKSANFIEFIRNVLANGRRFEVERKKLRLSNHDNLIFRKDGGIRLEQIIRGPYSTYPKYIHSKIKPKNALSAYGCNYLKEIFDNYPPAEPNVSFWVLEDGPCLIRYRTKEKMVSIVLDQKRDW